MNAIEPERPPDPRREGALVGLVVGGAAVVPFVASALDNGSLEWVLLSSIPAGIVAGAITAPRIAPGRKIGFGTVATAAATAFLVGDALVTVGVLVLYGPRNEWTFPAALGNTLGMFLLGVITVGWLAMLVLLPIATVGALLLRARLGHLAGPRS